MLIKNIRYIAALKRRTNRHPQHMTTAVEGIGKPGLIENNDQVVVTLKCGYQRADVGLQPTISHRHTAIVRVITVIRDNKTVIRQSITGDVDRQLGKWHQILLLRKIAPHVR